MRENLKTPKESAETEIHPQQINSLQIELMRRMGNEMDNAHMLEWIEEHSKGFRDYIETHKALYQHIKQNDVSEEDYKELINALLDKNTIH